MITLDVGGFLYSKRYFFHDIFADKNRSSLEYIESKNFELLIKRSIYIQVISMHLHTSRTLVIIDIHPVHQRASTDIQDIGEC